MISVLLADDDQLTRTGLRLIIESDHDLTVVGEAADGQEAIHLARALRPDVVLMDVRMPGWMAWRRPDGSSKPPRTVPGS
jgi:YesN/AraC family two-component response regulator